MMHIICVLFYFVISIRFDKCIQFKKNDPCQSIKYRTRRLRKKMTDMIIFSFTKVVSNENVIVKKVRMQEQPYALFLIFAEYTL
jgi:hypothetical protein